MRTKWIFAPREFNEVQTILAGFIAQRGAAANGAVKLRPKQPEPAVFTESYSCHFFTPDIKSVSSEANALVLLV